ncbi:MAG: methylmalonyl-CoA epimerase [Pyrinomonadaceae bacterium]
MKIDHIGIATNGIDEVSAFWRATLGVEINGTEEVNEQGVRVAMLAVGESRIELLEPTHDESPIAKFLEKRGPGIHHIALRVADIRAALNKLKASGARLIDETPRAGAGGCLVAFIHPATTGGVLVELVEHNRTE